VLCAALTLRLWGIKQGLPYVYNVDENANFVPAAVGFFSGSYDPGYFINPPAFSYLLHAVFAIWFGGGWPFGSRGSVSEAYAIHPTTVFVVARVTAAAVGVAALGFVYATGARLLDRRVGLVAAALMSVAFLPVFYSHLALNDVPALLPLMVSVWGSAGVLAHGRLRDYLIAGAGLGLAVATKYTAAIVVLPLLAAAAIHLTRGAAARRLAAHGLLISGVLAVAGFVVANPYAIVSFSEFWADVKKQQSAAGDLGKLGLTDSSGIHYYLWSLTWGLGWVPCALAALGAALAAWDDRRTAVFLIPWPVAFVVFMGLQDRYFGRWVMPAVPAVALLAAYAAVRISDLRWIRRTPRAGPLLLGGFTALLLAQGLVYSLHLDRVLARADTRNLAREWMVRHVPAGEKIVVEPIVPLAWVTDPGRATDITPTGIRWRKLVVTRTTLDERGRRRRGGVGRPISIEDYERTTRPALVTSYEGRGYCWVVIGSTQYGRAFDDPEEVPKAVRYYRVLARRGRLVYRITPYKPGQGPVKFNFDWSFNYYPMAYERPGPTVFVYRLHKRRCA
jgi:hypothetical protein